MQIKFGEDDEKRKGEMRMLMKDEKNNLEQFET